MTSRPFRRPIPGSAVMAVALLTLPSSAAAQSPDTSDPAATAPGYWEMVGGSEHDTHDVSYSFIGPGYNKPLSDRVGLTARMTFRYLSYEFRNGAGGDTSVSSPGFQPQVGLRFGPRGKTIRFRVGYATSREHRTESDRDGRIVDSRRWRHGVSLGSDLYYNLTKRDNIHAMVSFGTENSYLWSRLGYKRQVTNFDWRDKVTVYVGAEGITQGNDEIWSNMGGGLAEVLFVPARLSLMFRSGYKHSSFERGEDKKGPYFALGLYKRF